MWNYRINYKNIFGQSGFLYLMLGIILAAGVFFRVAGFDTHVTYIDELICLTEGHWNSQGGESSSSYQSPWDYAKKMILHEGVTYAPAQFLLTYYFVKPYQPLLSLEALAASRIPSVIFGCFSMVLLLLLFYRLSKGNLSYSILLPLTLLAVSRINIVNSQQNHTYIIGVLAFIVVMLALVWLYDSKRTWVWSGAAFLLCILPFSNYQLVPIVILAVGLALCAVGVRAAFFGGEWKTAWFATVLFIPALFISVLFAHWVMEHKASDSLPWWTEEFGFERSGEGFYETFSGLIKNIYFVFESLLLSGNNQAVNLLSIAAAVSIMSGGFGVLIYKRFKTETNILPLLLCFAAFGLYIFLYFTKAIALSPSRHTLILMPAILTVVFYCSLLIENSDVLPKAASTAYKRTLAGLNVLLLANAIMEYPEFYRMKTEIMQPQKVIEFSQKENISLVITDFYTYNKLYMFLEKEIAEKRIRMWSIFEVPEFPNEPFLLVGQDMSPYFSYKSGSYENGFFSRLLYENGSGYDFEPSPRINYWPNKMLIFRVDP